MDLRHDQLPWNEQIWAKINADLAHALSLSRRVRAPFEVFHVPEATQTVMADVRDPTDQFKYATSETLPVVELWVPFEIQESQVESEGNNFFALDRIVAAAYDLGYAEDLLLTFGKNASLKKNARISEPRSLWTGLSGDSNTKGYDVEAFYNADNPAGIKLFDAIVIARQRLRSAQRYEPFALFLSGELEGDLNSTIPGSKSLNTPVERIRPMVTAGIHSTPALTGKTALVVSVARSWVDIAQAVEPSVQFLRIGERGEYQMRLVERLAFRLKDPAAVCSILLSPNR